MWDILDGGAEEGIDLSDAVSDNDNDEQKSEGGSINLENVYEPYTNGEINLSDLISEHGSDKNDSRIEDLYNMLDTVTGGGAEDDTISPDDINAHVGEFVRYEMDAIPAAPFAKVEEPPKVEVPPPKAEEPPKVDDEIKVEDCCFDGTTDTGLELLSIQTIDIIGGANVDQRASQDSCINPNDIIKVVNVDYCPCRKTSKNGVCSKPEVLEAVENAVTDKGIKIVDNNKISNNKFINSYALHFKLKSELEVVTHLDLLNYADQEVIKENVVEEFKPLGPANTVEWLSDSHIHNVLDMYKEEFPEFDYWDSCLMSFERNGDELAKKNVSDFGSDVKVLGCVLNTAKRGSGEHWIAIAIDCRNKDNIYIRYFDSTGKPITKEVDAWCDKKIEELKTLYPNAKVSLWMNDVQHQHGNNECGVYCLYFIKYLLEYHNDQFSFPCKVSDDSMINFRRYIFNPDVSKEVHKTIGLPIS